MEWVSIVAVLALVQYLSFGVMVGRARGKYGVKAPAISGDPTFERYYRVQMNTLEQLMVVIPSLFIFATYINPRIAAVLGVVFIIGRQVYQISYVKDPASRSAGFLIGMIATMALLAGSLIGAIQGLLG